MWVAQGKGSLAWNKMECQAILVCGAEVGECNEWSRKNFGSNEWNEPTAGTWMCGEVFNSTLVAVEIPLE